MPSPPARRCRRDARGGRPGVTHHAVRVHDRRGPRLVARHAATSTASAWSFGAAGRSEDDIERHFGFRTIETRNGRFYLNGEPIYLRAALDQDYYPGTICTVPSVEFLEDQFRKAKELGLNCLRCHIKAADPRYYEVADRMGLLVWTELPNGGMSTDRSRGRKEKLLKGIVDRDGNHPSIVIWTIINENWGVDLVNDAGSPRLAEAHLRWLKAYDPTRLVVDNSPLAPSFHVESDIADYHFYAAFPDHRRAVGQVRRRTCPTAPPGSTPAWRRGDHRSTSR